MSTTPLTREDIVSAVTEALQSVTVRTETTSNNYTINTSSAPESITESALDTLRKVGLIDTAERIRREYNIPSAATVGGGQVAGVEHTAPATAATTVEVTPEVIEAVAEFLFDTGVETPMINSLRSVAACLRNDIDDPITGNDTPTATDTSPLVVHKKAALQDAISARDAVFFRLRNLAAQPISEFSYEQLARMGEELSVKQLQVHRCTAQLEQARAVEVPPPTPDQVQ